MLSAIGICVCAIPDEDVGYGNFTCIFRLENGNFMKIICSVALSAKFGGAYSFYFGLPFSFPPRILISCCALTHGSRKRK